MYGQIAIREKEKRAILYCRSVKGNYADLQSQSKVLSNYAKANELLVVRTYLESGTMDALTYNNFRLQAKYHEFEVLIVPELEMLGNSAIEITEEVSFLIENGVKVMSIKDGELNADTLPTLFRKLIRLKTPKYNLIR